VCFYLLNPKVEACKLLVNNLLRVSSAIVLITYPNVDLLWVGIGKMALNNPNNS
jgi:hypothetical protein